MGAGPLPAAHDIGALVEGYRRSGMEVAFSVVGDRGEDSLDGLDQAAGSVLFRTVREALANVLHHAGGAATAISIEVVAAAVHVVIRNDAPPWGVRGPASGNGAGAPERRLAPSGGSRRAAARAERRPARRRRARLCRQGRRGTGRAASAGDGAPRDDRTGPRARRFDHGRPPGRRPGGGRLDPHKAVADLGVRRRFERLSDRELQVLQAMARGATNREIAAELRVAERTVKAHVGSIFGKLEVRDRAGAIVLAHDVGFRAGGPDGSGPRGVRNLST
ncbi:LuxR C-terminal-related transcriptional regulator [Frankia sp. Cpl3]|nr:LuxR C-terminal-related transcriptional regulator [Frankia sp. Cpl3]